MRLVGSSILRVPCGGLGRRPSHWRLRAALGLAGLAAAVVVHLPAGAAELGSPNVVVHQDILNNLDWAAAAAARIRAEAGASAAAGPAVKEPPALPPVSYVLIEPERVAPPSRPTRKPTVLVESPESPALPEDQTTAQVPPEAGVDSTAPEPEAVAETKAADASPGAEIAAAESSSEPSDPPFAIPAPPEPTEPVTAAPDPIVAPSPPDPQPALPETQLLAEAPPEPAPPAETLLLAEAPPEPEPEPPAETLLLAEASPEPEPEPTAEAPTIESKPAKKSKARKLQTAARPPAELGAGELRLIFPEGSVDLSDSAKEKLGVLAEQLQQNSESERRIQLQAFASSSASNASVARRLSLARAIAVRTYLIEKGVRSRRIDVRALGANSDEGPPDRVDILDARS